MIDRAAGSRALDESELQKYQGMAISDAVRDSAGVPGSGMADAIGIGAGIAMGHQLAAAQPPPVPPPINDTAQWRVAIDGQATGPFTLDNLRAQVADGRLAPKILVWRQGMENWVSAGEVAELNSLFGAEPPPIPHEA